MLEARCYQAMSGRMLPTAHLLVVHMSGGSPPKGGCIFRAQNVYEGFVWARLEAVPVLLGRGVRRASGRN